MKAVSTPTDSSPNRAPGDESGFILIQTALLLLPLMLFAAMATDAGAWYLQGHKLQRTADAAALAGVAKLPNLLAMQESVQQVAARNGVVDATPGDLDDFAFGPTPQIRATSPSNETVDVEVRAEAPSFFGRVVLDSIEISRYATAQRVRDVRMGNPTSGLGTGTIPAANLGMPNDQMWLAISGFCADREGGDPLMSGFIGPTHFGCGPNANQVTSGAYPTPTFDPNGYTFVVDVEPGSTAIDLDVYEPGQSCSGPGATPGYRGPLLNFEIYGPNNSRDHEAFLASATPFAVIQPSPTDCITNSPSGDGWWPLANNLPSPGANGGFYYIRAFSRYPGSIDGFPSYSIWPENGFNTFSLRATRAGASTLCTFSTQDPTCPQLYALTWLPLFRNSPNDESPFYLAEIPATYAGERLVIQFFDAAEGISNLQFVDSNDQAMPFRWRYADFSLGRVSGWPYAETAFTPSNSTCTWGGMAGQPCLLTSNRSDWNDRFVEVEIEIPPDYTCGTDCWWQVRYVTNNGANDRSAWSATVTGSPIRLIE